MLKKTQNKKVDDTVQVDPSLSESVALQPNLDDTTIYMVGDHDTIAQIVQLLSYIRYAIKNKQQTKITVNIGSKIQSEFFNFDVNGFAIRDRIAVPYTEIN